MPKKVADIKKARQDRRKERSWTAAEIRKRAAQERARYKKLAENEPDALVSGGNMSKILEESCDDNEDGDPTHPKL